MRVALFATCLVDLFAPQIAISLRQLLERLGVTVEVVTSAVCCGQPAFNSGHWPEALPLTTATVEALRPYEAIVVPSASCSVMLSHGARRLGLAPPSVYEATSFLLEVLRLDGPHGHLPGRGLWVESCHRLRWLTVPPSPAPLLRNIEGLLWSSGQHASLCCGFGGTFSVHFPELSLAMADARLVDVTAEQPDFLFGTDVSCLLQLTSRLQHLGHALPGYHLVEILDKAGVGR